jgi:hypothetical protein
MVDAATTPDSAAAIRQTRPAEPCRGNIRRNEGVLLETSGNLFDFERR